jgi:hypothetical protein
MVFSPEETNIVMARLELERLLAELRWLNPSEGASTT